MVILHAEFEELRRQKDAFRQVGDEAMLPLVCFNSSKRAVDNPASVATRLQFCKCCHQGGD
jgi:hypothetical protein